MPTQKAMLNARDALTRLREGNTRYTQNVRSVDSLVSHSRRDDMDTQSPFAVIVGCSDSRAPAEVVFDQGLGDLFIIRVAGPIVAPSQIGSVEFAVEVFGTRLVVVMGHTGCGAIAATVDAVMNNKPAAAPSKNVLSIVNRLRPSVEPLVKTELAKHPARLRQEAGRANVRDAVNTLRHGSEVIERLAHEDGLAVLGCELDLHTGEVVFFDGLLD